MSFKSTSWGRKLMAEEWAKATNRSTRDVLDGWRHDEMMRELRSQRISADHRYRERRRRRENRYRSHRIYDSESPMTMHAQYAENVQRFERSTGIDWPFADSDQSKSASRVPAKVNQPHPKHPNVVITPEGMWRPAPGYTWVNREQARNGSNYKVKQESFEELIDRTVAKEKSKDTAIAEHLSQLTPNSQRKPDKKTKPSAHQNRPHPKHPNVLIRPNGNLTPAPGYTWVDPNSPGYDVKPIEQIPNVIRASDGTLTPAPGYAWLELGRKVTPIDEIPNIRLTRDGHMIPEDGYTWIDSDAPGKGVKPEEEGSLSEAIGCLLCIGIAIALGVYFMN